MISKDTHLVFSIFTAASNRSTQTQQQGIQKEGQERKDTVTRILKRPVNTGCTSCEQMLNEARSLLGAANLKEGYEKVLELVKEKHRSEKHYGLVQKAMGCIVTKLGEAAVPGRVKPVLSSHSKIDKTNVLKTNGSLMKVESIAECSLGAFCNTFDLH